MAHKNKVQFILLLVGMALSVHVLAQNTVTMKAAELQAMRLDPELTVALLKERSLRDDAVADGQLSDPQFKVGVFNMPLDSFNISENPTTQLRFGVMQKLAKGNSLVIQQQIKMERADSQKEKSKDIALQMLRDVRLTFLEIIYQQKSRKIIEQSKILFQQMVEVTQSQYASGRATQQEVIQAELELTRHDERLIRARMSDQSNRSVLAQWVGRMAQLNLVFDETAEFDLPSWDAIEERLFHRSGGKYD